MMDVLPNTIYAREAFLPMSLPVKHLPNNYVPFVDVTDARKHAANFRRVSRKKAAFCRFRQTLGLREKRVAVVYRQRFICTQRGVIDRRRLGLEKTVVFQAYRFCGGEYCCIRATGRLGVVKICRCRTAIVRNHVAKRRDANRFVERFRRTVAHGHSTAAGMETVNAFFNAFPASVCRIDP